MVDVSELEKLSPEELKAAQEAIALFRLLGLSNEDISMLPKIVKQWPKLIEIVNGHSDDLTSLRMQINKNEKPVKPNAKPETPDSLREMVGFDSHVESVTLPLFGGKPNAK